MADDRYRRGLEKLEDIASDLGCYTIELPFGDVYPRPGLNVKSRGIVTVAALTVTGHVQPQLKVIFTAL